MIIVKLRARSKIKMKLLMVIAFILIITMKRKLMLDRLELNPENRLMTGTDYVLYAPEGETAGKNITTSFSLQKVYK